MALVLSATANRERAPSSNLFRLTVVILINKLINMSNVLSRCATQNMNEELRLINDSPEQMKIKHISTH